MAVYFDFTEDVELAQQLNDLDCTSSVLMKDKNKKGTVINEVIDQSHSESDRYLLVNTKHFKNKHLHIPTVVKRALCLECHMFQDSDAIYYHRMFFCGGKQPENLGWKLVGKGGYNAYCFRCKKSRKPRSIILHVKYTCGKKFVKCLFCPRIFYMNKKGPRKLSLAHHMQHAHGKSWQTVERIMLNLSDETIMAIEKENLSIPTTQPEDEETFVREKEEDNSFEQGNVNTLPNTSNGINSYGSNMGIENYHRNGKRGRFNSWDPMISCSKCSTIVRVDNLRFHKNVVCGKTPEEAQCVGKSPTTYLCLRCNKILATHIIEFHLKYICGKQPIAVQCFYCSRLFKQYKLLLQHMAEIHKRKHFLVELISILPEAEENISEKSDVTNLQKSRCRVVRHFFSGNISSTTFLNTSVRVNDSVENVPQKLDTAPQFYKCFYCEEIFNYVYQVLDHMEVLHTAIHNTYDVLKESFAKLLG